jgi:hypothetical protein
MPFSPDTKARMFVRCARICCLCLKQCGTNIEAAHIVAEAVGGPNDEDNGIPACMDCHTEISHYDPKQPKGNKFTTDELRLRRDRIYQLVDSGALFAQIYAIRAQTGGGSGKAEIVIPSESTPSLSTDAKELMKGIKAGNVYRASITAKLRALGSDQRALVVDALVRDCANEKSMEAIGEIVKDGTTDAQAKLVLSEQMLRKATLISNAPAKAAFMKSFPVEVLKGLDESLRTAYFQDVIATINADQFGEVNEIVPALDGIQAAIPASLAAPYVDALIDQSGSSARRGAPAAKRLLESLPDELVTAALESLSLTWRTSERRDVAHAFLKRTQKLWPPSRKRMLKDYLGVKWETFARRYGVADD